MTSVIEQFPGVMEQIILAVAGALTAAYTDAFLPCQHRI
jgi:hypothetical protein